jgi:hypothetical protein
MFGDWLASGCHAAGSSVVFIAFHLQRQAVLSIFFNHQALSSIRKSSGENPDH